MKGLKNIFIVAILALLPLAASAKNIPGATWVRTTGLAVTRGGAIMIACEVKGDTDGVMVFQAASYDAPWNHIYTIESASDAVLWRGLTGEMHLFHTQDGYLKDCVCTNPDADSGKWGDSVSIVKGYCCSPPVVLRTLAVVLPVYYSETDDTGVLLSMDRGATWMHQHSNIKIEGKTHTCRPNPVLMASKKGLLSLMNGASGYQWKWKSESRDFGRSWSKAERYVYSPDYPMAMVTLRSGKWCMAKNGYLDQMLNYTPNRIVVYISDDEGKSWFGGLVLDDRVDSNSPCIADSGDGYIYVAYSYNPIFGDKSEVCLARTSEMELNTFANEEYAKVGDCKVILSCDKTVASYKEAIAPYVSTKAKPAGEPLTMATYNIEYENAGCKYPFTKRLEYVRELFEVHKFDVVGVQEPWRPQYQQLVEALKPDYESIWACTNLVKDDFSNAIFYRKDRVELLDNGIIWYTEVPGQRYGFGGTTSRLCIWGKFKDKKTGNIFFLFNSHFDFSSYEAQMTSARLLATKVREIAGEYPSLCTGDFNSNDENPAMQFLAAGPFLKDARTEAKKVTHAKMTTSGLYREPANIPDNGYRIDHIYITPGISRVDSWEILAEQHAGIWGGSDHNAIKIQWQILK